MAVTAAAERLKHQLDSNREGWPNYPMSGASVATLVRKLKEWRNELNRQ